MKSMYLDMIDLEFDFRCVRCYFMCFHYDCVSFWEALYWLMVYMANESEVAFHTKDSVVYSCIC